MLFEIVELNENLTRIFVFVSVFSGLFFSSFFLFFFLLVLSFGKVFKVYCVTVNAVYSVTELFGPFLAWTILGYPAKSRLDEFRGLPTVSKLTEIPILTSQVEV